MVKSVSLLGSFLLTCSPCYAFNYISDISGSATSATYASGNGLHIETGRINLNGGTTGTITFGFAYLTAPFCSATTANIGAGGNAPDLEGGATTTNVTIRNNLGGNVSIDVICVGF